MGKQSKLFFLVIQKISPIPKIIDKYIAKLEVRLWQFHHSTLFVAMPILWKTHFSLFRWKNSVCVTTSVHRMPRSNTHTHSHETSLLQNTVPLLLLLFLCMCVFFFLFIGPFPSFCRRLSLSLALSSS